MTALSDLLNAAKGDRSVDRLIEAAEKRGHVVDRGTVFRALNGDHAKRPREETLSAFAAVFELDIRKVREAADRPAGELGPWVPTSEAAQLDRDQRTALDRLIKTIVRGGAEDARPATNTKGDDEPDGGVVIEMTKPSRSTPKQEKPAARDVGKPPRAKRPKPPEKDDWEPR